MNYTDRYITTLGDSQVLAPLFEGGHPVCLDQGGLYICQGGRASVVIDAHQYAIKDGDLIVAFPHSVVQVLDTQGDFRGQVIVLDTAFFASIQVPDRANKFLSIRDNPCISLTAAETTKILSLFTHLQAERTHTEHPLRSEIDECLLRILAYEVLALYIAKQPLVQQHRSRSDMIFQQFIFSLFTHFHTHRSLQYYAQEQSITPRHLSTVVRQVSGQTASDWIVVCDRPHENKVAG